ncbi:DUF4326 domain-containing protein [Sphingobium sp. YR768]|uniref:DUF4326 domain-containing protein n=1 Tax=Sphingobium sp. YR768 TaxID=1884365 RepID=UPI0008D4AE26|nr:DUF4326 domain-containing protein [Sphingobium sp. YR768]SEQ59705.1 protein of unknown function [Sphingobium sp. YR768]
MEAARRLMDRGLTPPIMVPEARQPRRLQRPRKQGGPLGQGVRYVGRPTDFANPFDGRDFGHARSVRLHARWLDGRLGDLSLEMLGFCPAEIEAMHRLLDRVLRRLPELSGLDLQCWCPTTSRWCHADNLLRLANHPDLLETAR